VAVELLNGALEELKWKDAGQGWSSWCEAFGFDVQDVNCMMWLWGCCMGHLKSWLSWHLRC
jgi:hypothetical protein